MTDEQHREPSAPTNRIDIFLDDAATPLLSTTPPLAFDLDTSNLHDGPHVMRIEAYDSQGVKGVRQVDFVVRNGPGIALSGLKQNDVLDGKIPVIVNAYGGTNADWEPAQAETPAPVPTWAWVLLILVIAFGLFYGVQQWSPTADFARTPTYGTYTTAPGPVEAAAAAAVPAGAPSPSQAGTSTPGPTATGTAPTGTLTAEDTAKGAALYSANCAACHQASGQGLPSVFPPLAGNSVVNAADPTEHIETVLNGKQGSTIDGVSYASPMPTFKGILNDADIAAIVNHERTSWGNAAPKVNAADIAALRD